MSAEAPVIRFIENGASEPLEMLPIKWLADVY